MWRTKEWTLTPDSSAALKSGSSFTSHTNGTIQDCCGYLDTPCHLIHRIAKTLGTDPAMTISSVSWAQQATLRPSNMSFSWQNKFQLRIKIKVEKHVKTTKTWGMLSHHDVPRPSWPLPDGRHGRSSERPFCFSWKESHSLLEQESQA